MTRNPFINAFAALSYIVAIVFTISFIDQTEVNTGIAQYLMPILMLSLFTLSAAVMAYIFCFIPITLYMENKKEEAIRLFLKTITIFGILIFCIALLSFLIM